MDIWQSDLRKLMGFMWDEVCDDTTLKPLLLCYGLTFL